MGWGIGRVEWGIGGRYCSMVGKKRKYMYIPPRPSVQAYMFLIHEKQPKHRTFRKGLAPKPRPMIEHAALER